MSNTLVPKLDICLPHTRELEDLALKTVWFKKPPETLASPLHFVAHVLTYGTHADIKILRKYLNDEQLGEALDNAPAGVLDPRSWAYWNLKFGRDPTRPLPKRSIE